MVNSLFNAEEQRVINLVRIKLQVMFVSDLLEAQSNKIKECFWSGRRDKFSSSKFKWPQVLTDDRATVLWKKFLTTIATSDRNLLSPINTSWPTVPHRE